MQALPPDVRLYERRTRRPSPARSALLLIDLQYYFLDIARPILPQTARLIGACRRAGLPVLYTAHGHWDPLRDGGMLAEWWDDLIPYGGPEWEIISDIQPAPGETVYEKNRYSAFLGTTLEADLRRDGRTELIIGGVLTNCCCETTARDAFVRDFRVFFLTDATATVHEDLHVASLKNLAFGFAYLTQTESVIQTLQSRPGPPQ